MAGVVGLRLNGTETPCGPGRDLFASVPVRTGADALDTLAREIDQPLILESADGRAALYLVPDGTASPLARLEPVGEGPDTLPSDATVIERIGHSTPLDVGAEGLFWSVHDLPETADPIERLSVLVRATVDRIVPAAPGGALQSLKDLAPLATALPWVHGEPGGRRAALWVPETGWLSIEECDPLQERPEWIPTEHAQILVLSGSDRNDLTRRVRELKDEAATLSSGQDLKALSARLSGARPRGFRIAMVVDPRGTDTKTAATRSLDIALKLLASGKEQAAHPAGVFLGMAAGDRPVGLLFPGQGAQYAGMLADSVIALPGLREWFDLLERIERDADSARTSRVVFRTWPEGSAGAIALRSLSGGGLATLTGALALSDLLKRLGLKPAAALGHSNGENAALVVSGVLRTQTRRGIFTVLTYMSGLFASSDRSSENIPGRCFALSLPKEMTAERFKDLLGPDCYVTMDNCPSQKVVWGRAEKIDTAVEALKAEGAMAVPLPITQPYHTPLFAPIKELFVNDYNALNLGPGEIPLYSGLSGGPFPGDKEAIVRLASGQWSSTVQFQSALERMHDDGVRIFLDVGASGRLAGFARDTLKDRPHVALAMDNEARPDATAPLRTIAQLYTLGALDRVSLSDVPPVTAGTAEPLPDIAPAPVADPTPASEAATEPTLPTLPAADAAFRARNGRLVSAHQRLMQEFLDGQARSFIAFAQASNRHAPRKIAAPRTQLPQAATAAPQPTADWLAQWGGCTVERGSDGLKAILTLDPKHAALADHPFGRVRTVQNSGADALLVLPLFMSMELCVAACLQSEGPGWQVAAVENLRGLRWLASDGEPLRLSIDAQRQRDGAYAVTISDPAGPAAQCTVRLARTLPEAPGPLPRQTIPPTTEMETAADFQARLFHGPSYKSLRETLAVDRTGVTVRLSVPTQSRLAEGPVRIAASGPLLDSSGQILAFQNSLLEAKAFVLFPFAVDAIRFFAPPPSSGETITTVSRQERNLVGIKGDLDYLDGQGKPLIRIENLQMKFFDWSENWRTMFFPRPTRQPLGETVLHEGDLSVTLLPGLPEAQLQDGAGIWARMLARTVLTPAERPAFLTLPERGPRRQEWMLGRLAAKSAAMTWLGSGADLGDVIVLSDEGGAPRGVTANGTPMSLSIAHSGGAAVAVAASPDLAVGIDMEPRDRGAPALRDPSLAFAPDEADAVAALGSLRAWCAKEAVGKALGMGLAGSPLHYRLEMTADGDLNVLHEGRVFPVRFLPHDTFEIALCVTEASTVSQTTRKLVAEAAQ